MRNARQRLLALGAFTAMIFALWASVARADELPTDQATNVPCTVCGPPTFSPIVAGFFDGN